jgi:thiosulfate/3-mercaptopyruvate sulfurtransferase
MPLGTITRNELDTTTDHVLLDMRSMGAYNGWPLGGPVRGGHLPGARPFPVSWFDIIAEDEILGALAEKGATPEVPVVVCGHDDRDGAHAAAQLVGLGFADVRVLVGGQSGWSSQPGRPLARLSRWQHLVPTEWLHDVLAGVDTIAPPTPEFVLAHVNYDHAAEYRRGHIPGAIHLNTLALEEPDFWNRRTPAELDRALRDHGIRHDTTVVLYGRTGEPSMDQDHPGMEAGHIAAMRAAAILLYAGVRDVRVLDGGLNAWERSGGAVVTEPTLPESVPDVGVAVPARPELMVDLEEAREILAAPDGELVSIRSWSEFVGEVSGYHYVLPKGRIDGAVFGNCGSDAYHMQNYRNCDHTMRDHEEVAARWRAVGVVPEKRVAFYCGTGWRGSEAFFCAWLMGWDRTAVYDGGWYEWSDDERNPMATGIPEESPRAAEAMAGEQPPRRSSGDVV